MLLFEPAATLNTVNVQNELRRWNTVDVWIVELRQ
jgi:hypothetical protein